MIKKLFSIYLSIFFIFPLLGNDKDTSSEEWIREVRSSVVSVHSFSREGALIFSSSGFVISKDGKIATCLSSVKKSSLIKVEFEDGRLIEVDSVYASETSLDMAILKIEGRGYRPLEFSREKNILKNSSVVVLGYSMGIESKFLKGNIKDVALDNNKRIELDFKYATEFLGAPLFNENGQVIGLLSKALNSENRFASNIEYVDTLLINPNPISMNTWVKEGELNPKYWREVFGAHWQEDSGVIKVTGKGEGFGGRALCLWQRSKPKNPIEVSVKVKLDDEAGAAGLVFNADGKEKHYGFYPSGGKLRLTYFGGPSVYTWEILDEIRTNHYKEGMYNHLKVILEDDSMKCYVNNHLVITSNHKKRVMGRVGLAKFRDTKASFKNFSVKKHQVEKDNTEEKNKISNLVDKLPPFSKMLKKDIDLISQQSDLSRIVLEEKQKKLLVSIKQNKKLLKEIHTRSVCHDINKILLDEEEDINLWKLSLLVSKLDNEDLDLLYYQKKIERMVKELKKGTKALGPIALKDRLDKYLFEEHGFHGAKFDFYKKSNSYLNRVLEEKKGIPLSLSILYMELGRRIGLNLKGVGLPGHFVVKLDLGEAEPLYIDAYDGGKVLETADLKELVSDHANLKTFDQFLEPMLKKQMIRRMLNNLLAISEKENDRDSMLRYLTAELSINPDLINERVMMSVIYYEVGRQHAAEEQLQLLLNGEIRLEDVRKIEDMLVYMMNNPKQ